MTTWPTSADRAATLPDPASLDQSLTDTLDEYERAKARGATIYAELAGYGQATRSGVTVNIGRNAEVAMTLNPALSQLDLLSRDLARDEWLIVHGVHLADDHGLSGTIVHNPRSNMTQQVGYAPAGKDNGIVKSKGTVNNVVNLSRDHKPVVVYVAPTKQFRTIKTFDDIKGLLAQCDSDSVERIVSELHLHVA